MLTHKLEAKCEVVHTSSALSGHLGHLPLRPVSVHQIQWESHCVSISAQELPLLVEMQVSRGHSADSPPHSLRPLFPKDMAWHLREGLEFPGNHFAQLLFLSCPGDPLHLLPTATLGWVATLC